jgi:peroxiredoxin Q/BCP
MTNQAPYLAPDFQLQTSDGRVLTLTDFAGKWLVLYFYPKDDTPGCTTEACGIRDARDEITELGSDIIGVSRDNASSHDKFKAKYNLNFTLASDPDHVVMEAYGAWGKNRFGKMGVLRKTFIISPNGQVVKEYGRVTPLGHGSQIVKDLRELTAQTAID